MIRTVTLALFLLASVNLGIQLYERHFGIEDTSTDGFVLMCAPAEPFDVRARVLIEALLLVAVLAGIVKKHARTLLTAISLLGVLAVYFSWWQYIFRVAVNAELPVPSLNHFAYLWKGNPADLLIAVATVSLVLWHVVSAFKSLFRTDAS